MRTLLPICIENRSSFIIPVEESNDNFIISRDRDILLISWERSDEITILEEVTSLREVTEKESLHINDAKVDATGRLWFGTFSSTDLASFENGAGALYSFDGNGIKTQVDGVSVSNGLTWNEQLGKFCYIDSFKGTIDQYDFDLEKGEVCKSSFSYILCTLPQSLWRLQLFELSLMLQNKTVVEKNAFLHFIHFTEIQNFYFNK